MEKKIDMNSNVSVLPNSLQTDELNKWLADAEGAEDISLRGENVKHFDMGGNRRQAIPTCTTYREILSVLLMATALLW